MIARLLFFLHAFEVQQVYFFFFVLTTETFCLVFSALKIAELGRAIGLITVKCDVLVSMIFCYCEIELYLGTLELSQIDL
jgi:hypothetical protein